MRKDDYILYNLELLEDKLNKATVETLQSFLNKIYSTARIHKLWYRHPETLYLGKEDKVCLVWRNGEKEYIVDILKKTK